MKHGTASTGLTEGAETLLPAKLAAKIQRGEFTDMGELLPEFWSSLREEDADAKRESMGRSGRKVTDIYTWLQCYSYRSGLQLPLELMAYMASHDGVGQPRLPGPGMGLLRRSI